MYMKNNVYIATLKLTFDRSTFYEDNIYSRGEFIYITKQFFASNFSIAFYSLTEYLEYELADDGCLSNCSVEIVSLVKAGDSYS